MTNLVPFPTGAPTLSAAIDAFFADRDLAVTTRRAYAGTFRAIGDVLGGDRVVGELTPARLQRVMTQRWALSSPRTWNARLAAIQSLVRFCQRQGWLTVDPTAALERHRVARDDSRAIAHAELEELWSRDGIALREKLLWRFLYSTAARTSEVLALNIENLDLGRKRAVITGKGGHRESIVWNAGTARLLPRYLADRITGPVFVTARQPNVVPADLDRSSDGRARLSYQRAWALFRKASDGRWTLHQLRHSALTHLGEQGVASPLLMAKSRHRDARTLSRYVQPGIEAVARLTAQHDPARRRTGSARNG